MTRLFFVTASATLLLFFCDPLCGEDWTQFRGAGASGISAERGLPTEWSDTKNLQWKTRLPGAGSASPIVVGDRVFVICYSGYGEGEEQRAIAQLKRHVVCVDRKSGEISWSRTIDARQPEDVYQGYITDHGYASNTPVTDGERLYVMLGKSGVLTFDFDGKELWRVDVGRESSNRRWGSAASLILHKNILIVNAAEESRSIRALDKKTGKELWKSEGAALELAFGTPNLVHLKGGRTELVISMPGEVWGLNIDNGKLRWFAETQLTGNICPTLVVDDDIVYAFGGFRSSGSHAIRAGGRGDVTETHVLWTQRSSSYVATPLLHEGHLYWIDDRGQAHCIEAKTGEVVYRERIRELSGGGRPFYASPVLANGKLYVVSRFNGTLVLSAKPKFEELARNRFAGDESDFNATPAISRGQLLIRSDRYLYSVAAAGSD